jgi:hypothetical protein
MAKFYDEITPHLRELIEAQHIFFVASAPLSADGHVNLSPKGLDALRILSPKQVAYLDLTGSGNETSAHLLENGRITLMLCTFEGAPNIIRLFGRGTTVLPDTPEWDMLIGNFTQVPGMRQIIKIDVEMAQTSCGFGVPLYEYQGERDQAIKWAEHKGEDGLELYRQEKNFVSLDGLPSALKVAHEEQHEPGV